MSAAAGGRAAARRTRAVMRRELIDVLRDRRSLLLTLLYPISMLLMYGYGIRYDVDNVPLVLLDRSETPESRALVNELTSSGYFRLVRVAADERALERALATERARVAVVIPRDFARRLRAGAPAAVQVLLDASDANTATIAEGYALAVVNRFAARVRAGAAAAAPPVRLETRVWYNPQLESVNFIVPGIIAVIMMIVGAILTALSIVKEKERGTLEQLLVSPVRPLEMMIGKIVPYTVIAIVDLVLIVAAGAVVFGVPIRGSLVHFAVVALLYLVCALAVGVFVSTLADTMQSAMLAAVFISLLPAVLLSGFVFPIEYMPLPLQVLTFFFPGRYFVEAIRGIYLKGVGLEVLWPQALLLAVFAAGTIAVSAARFRDRLD